MILWRKEPLTCILKNTVILDDDDGYVYISVPTYEQAVRISERFNNDFSRVCSELNNQNNVNSMRDPIYAKLYNNIAETMPPIFKMLMPFLKLVYPLKFNWDEENLKEQAYGILHQMSMMIDFNLLLAQPKEIRNNVVLQRSILESYKDSWDALLHNYKDDVINVIPAQQPQQVQAPQPVVQAQPQQVVNTANQTNAVNNDDAEDEDEENNPIALKLKALAESVKKQREEEKKRDAEKKAEIERLATNNASGVKKEQVLNNIKDDASEAASVLDEFDV